MTDSGQVLQVTVKGAELGIDTIQKLLPELLKMLGNGVTYMAKTAIAAAKNRPGEKRMPKLTSKRTQIASVKIDKETRALKDELKMHGVDFHIMKNGEKDFTLFFEANNAALIESALTRTLKKELSAPQGKSVKQKMSESRQKAATNKVKKPKKPKAKTPSKGRIKA